MPLNYVDDSVGLLLLMFWRPFLKWSSMTFLEFVETVVALTPFGSGSVEGWIVAWFLVGMTSDSAMHVVGLCMMEFGIESDVELAVDGSRRNMMGVDS